MAEEQSKKNIEKEVKLDLELVTCAIFEGVQRALDSVVPLNPLQIARNFFSNKKKSNKAEKDTHEKKTRKDTNFAVYKAISRTFNKLIEDGDLKIIFSNQSVEKYKNKWISRSDERLKKLDQVKAEEKIIAIFARKRNNIELNTYENMEALEKAVYSDLENEVERIITAEAKNRNDFNEEYIGLYYGKTLRELCNNWYPSDKLKRLIAAIIPTSKRQFAPFIPTIGDIHQSWVKLSQLSDVYGTNSNEIASNMNKKLYADITNDKESKGISTQLLFMSIPALLCSSELTPKTYDNSFIEVLKTYHKNIINSKALSDFKKIFDNKKTCSFFLSIGPDFLKTDSVFSRLYASLNPSAADYQKELLPTTAEILGRYYYLDKIDDKLEELLCLGGDPDPDRLPTSIEKSEQYFQLMNFINMGIGIKRIKDIAKEYYLSRIHNKVPKGMGVCVIIGDNSSNKIPALARFLVTQVREESPPFFNRVYMLDKYVKELQKEVAYLTKGNKRETDAVSKDPLDYEKFEEKYRKTKENTSSN